MEWLYMIIFFAIAFVIVMVVGFLGNKLSDKAENAFREQKLKRKAANNQLSGPTESLASRMAQSGYQSQKKEHKAQFCTSCGQHLAEGTSSCPKCGAIVSSYKEFK